MRSGNGVEPRNDGVVSHKPFSVTLVAVVASRQFPESRNQQTLLIRRVGEAGNPEAIAALVDAGDGVDMAAHVEQGSSLMPWR